MCKFQEDWSKILKINPKFVKIKFLLNIYSFIHLIHNYFPILLEYEECYVQAGGTVI